MNRVECGKSRKRGWRKSRLVRWRARQDLAMGGEKGMRSRERILDWGRGLGLEWKDNGLR